MRSLQICPKKNSLYILDPRERRLVLILSFPREWNIQVASFHYDLRGSQSSELVMVVIVGRVKSRRHKGRASILASQGENGSYLPALILYIYCQVICHGIVMISSSGSLFIEILYPLFKKSKLVMFPCSPKHITHICLSLHVLCANLAFY